MDPSLGAVGRVMRANPELLDLLAANGYLPVVACVGGDRAGRLYNVNADQMAVACAAAFAADVLLFLTDVAGVLDAEKRVRRELSAAEAEGLIAAGVATGGMQAKLNAAVSALRQGVGQVRIAPGADAGIVERVLAGDAAGTRITL
jgi:acetylglutamate kinase